MKILLVTHHWHTNSHHSKFSGYQNLAFDLAKNHDVTLLTWGKEDSEITDKGVKVKIIKTADNDKLFLRRLKISKVANEMAPQFDTVHILYSDCGYALSPSLNFTATLHVTPKVARYNDWKQMAFLRLKSVLIERKVFRNAKVIVVVSSNLYNELYPQYGSKLILIPHGIDVNYWRPEETNASKVLKETYLSRGDYKKIAICVGFHGVNYDILEKVVKQNGDVLFIFVGLKKSIPEPNVIEKTGISDSELKAIYQIGDIFYRPVDFATANNSILEAMAMGKTIVTDRIDGITDYLNDENSLLASNESEHLQLFRKAKEDNDLSDKLAKKALYSAQNEFAWEVVNTKLLSVYKNNQ